MKDISKDFFSKKRQQKESWKMMTAKIVPFGEACQQPREPWHTELSQ